MEEYRADNSLYGYLLYDIKLMDSLGCIRNDRSREWRDPGKPHKAFQKKAAIWIRIPVVGGVNDTDRIWRNTEFSVPTPFHQNGFTCCLTIIQGAESIQDWGKNTRAGILPPQGITYMQELLDMCLARGYQAGIEVNIDGTGMNERIRRLRRESLETEAHIDMERAK